MAQANGTAGSFPPALAAPDNGRRSGGGVHRWVVMRLVLAWIGLSVVIGALVVFSELEKQDRFVLQLALKESALFSGDAVRGLRAGDSSARAELAQLAQGLVRRNFVVVELYDADQGLVLEAVRPGSGELEDALHRRMHAFPLGTTPHHEKRWVDERLFLLVLVPLRDAGGTTAGFFEGVYEVDKPTLVAIRQDLWLALAVVTLALLVATAAMYPIILGLNRDLLRLSSELLRANVELMDVLGNAIAKRDASTNSHNARVTFYAVRFAEALKLPARQIRDLIAGAFLHDVGKIGIHDAILLKPGPLTAEEFEEMKHHVRFGAEITSRAEWLRGARDVVEFHHERYDGGGYPSGLRGDQIPLNARLFAIVDVFDALTSERPYKSGWTFDAAMAVLEHERGGRFDPALVRAFAAIAPALYGEANAADAAHLEQRLRDVVARYFFTAAGIPSGHV